MRPDAPTGAMRTEPPLLRLAERRVAETDRDLVGAARVAARPVRMISQPLAAAAAPRPAPPPSAVILLRPRARLFVPSAAWGGRRRREILFGAAFVAVLSHILLTVAIVEAPRLWPAHFAPPPPPPSAADQPPTIEMLMDKNRYVGGSNPTQAASPTPPAPDTAPTPPQPKPPAAPDLTTTTPTSRDQVTVPPPSPASTIEPPPTPAQPTPSQAPPGPPPEPEVDIDPSNNVGYGEQDDPNVIPAKPDDRHANRMPVYPAAAGRRGEEGSVEMLVQIAADGSVTSVEIATSSGYPTLDKTAHDAVAHWHFRPAMQNGVAVPTQMMQVFNFKIDR